MMNIYFTHKEGLENGCRCDVDVDVRGDVYVKFIIFHLFSDNVCHDVEKKMATMSSLSLGDNNFLEISNNLHIVIREFAKSVKGELILVNKVRISPYDWTVVMNELKSWTKLHETPQCLYESVDLSIRIELEGVVSFKTLKGAIFLSKEQFKVFANNSLAINSRLLNTAKGVV